MSSSSRSGSLSSQHHHDQEHQRALDELAAHGAAFMAAFGEPVKPTQQQPNHKKQRQQKRKRQRDEIVSLAEHSASEQACAPLVAQQPKQDNGKERRVPETIVFEAASRTARGSPEEARTARMGLKDFMSSKVQRVGSASTGSTANLTATAIHEDDDEERSSLANDKALSHLLSTTLFAPGTSIGASDSVGLSHRDTAARLAELSASASSRKGAAAGRGWGEARVKADALASMPAHMRAGMRRAEANRTSKEVERAKELGIYHPSLKRGLGRTPGADLIMGTRDKDRKARTRDKGMGVGVGRFKGGILHLSKDEVGHLAGSSKTGGTQKGSKAKGKQRK